MATIKNVNINGTVSKLSVGVYDVSEQNNNRHFSGISEILSNANTFIPENDRFSGMQIKFIQDIPATFEVVRTDNLTEQPETGTEIQTISLIQSGTYNEDELSIMFETLPQNIGYSVTYYFTNTIEETTTYISWFITKLTNSFAEYVQWRLMSTDWSTNIDNWQGVDDKPAYSSDNLVESGGIFKETFKLRDINDKETLDTTSEINGYTILTNGRLYRISTGAYRKIDVEGCYYVRFLGIVQERGNAGTVGVAFYDETADPTTSTNTGFISSVPYEVGTSSSKTTKEYIISVPQNAKYFYVMSKFSQSSLPGFNDNFYCYLTIIGKAAGIDDIQRVDETIKTKMNETPKSFVAVMTSHSVHDDLTFNIDNKLRKLTYPDFYVATNKSNPSRIDISAGEIDISNLPPAYLYYLLLDENGDLSVDSVYGGNTVDKYILAIFCKKNSDADAKFINFRGCESGLHGNHLWLIDGKCDIDYLEDKLQNEITQTKDNSTTIDGYIITRLGQLYSTVTGGYKKIDVEGCSYVRFLGVVQESNSLSKIGVAFFDETADPTTTTNTGFISGMQYEIGTEDHKELKEYILPVPENAKYFYLMSKIASSVVAGFTDNFYCYLVRGYFAGIRNITDLNNSIENADIIKQEYSDTKTLFIGSLVQKATEETKLSDNTDNTRVSMHSAVCFPHQNITLHVKIKDGYFFGIRYGSRRSSFTGVLEWYKNGDYLAIPNGYLFYRCYFSKGSSHDNTLTVNEIQNLINSGEIEITYKEDYDIIKANIESEKYIKSILRHFFNLSEGLTYREALEANTEVPNIPTFGHASDIHGDAKRYAQFLDYCDYIGVDAALITGDFVLNNPNQACQFINDIADTHKTMVLPCTGNHDCYGLYTSQEQREKIVGHLMDKNNVVTNPLENYPTYFYKDITAANIRIISLNTFEGHRLQHRFNITEQQCNWFIDALASTPNGYGIMVLYHAPEKSIVAETGYDTFYQNKYAYSLYYHTGITGTPITEIIDAFISRISTTISYSVKLESNSSSPINVTVNPDFTNVSSDVEFIAHVTGHQHIDWIGTVNDTTNRQLMLNIPSTCINFPTGDPFGANLSDLPRDGVGPVQDAFNIYGIDRKEKTVKIVRVGSNVNYEGIERKFMVIPYSI